MARGVKTGGRKKGTPNKFSSDIKAAIEQAFDAVGGAEYLTGIARNEPGIFCALLGKVLPAQLLVSGNVNVGHYVVAAPTISASPVEWAQQHAPTLQ